MQLKSHLFEVSFVHSGRFCDAAARQNTHCTRSSTKADQSAYTIQSLSSIEEEIEIKLFGHQRSSPWIESLRHLRYTAKGTAEHFTMCMVRFWRLAELPASITGSPQSYLLPTTITAQSTNHAFAQSVAHLACSSLYRFFSSASTIVRPRPIAAAPIRLSSYQGFR